MQQPAFRAEPGRGVQQDRNPLAVLADHGVLEIGHQTVGVDVLPVPLKSRALFGDNQVRPCLFAHHLLPLVTDNIELGGVDIDDDLVRSEYVKADRGVLEKIA